MRLIDADLLEPDADDDDGECWAYSITQIENAPTIEPKKGKWIRDYDTSNTISGKCSVCDWEAHLYEDDVVGMNYCPNCGADMRGE